MTLTSCRKIVTSLSFFGFLANLEQSGGRIPYTESAEVMFSVIVTFCHTKTQNRTKNLKHSSNNIAFSKGTFSDKKCYFFCKKMLTLAKLRRPRHWKVYFLKLHIGVYLCAKLEVSSIILTSFRRGVILPPPKTNHLKSPPRLGLRTPSNFPRPQVPF